VINTQDNNSDSLILVISDYLKTLFLDLNFYTRGDVLIVRPPSSIEIIVTFKLLSTGYLKVWYDLNYYITNYRLTHDFNCWQNLTEQYALADPELLNKMKDKIKNSIDAYCRLSLNEKLHLGLM